MMAVSKRLIMQTLKRFESLNSRTFDEYDFQVHMEEWVKNFSSWKEEHFLTACEIVKQTSSYFPRIADMYKAYYSIAKRIPVTDGKSYDPDSASKCGQLWVQLTRAGQFRDYARALEILDLLEKSGCDVTVQRQLYTARLYKDADGIKGAAIDVSKSIGNGSLGKYVVHAAGKEAEGKDSRSTSCGSAKSLGDVMGGKLPF